jgi:hypothetical protein
MEKKIYSRPAISEIKLDSEINLVLMSIGSNVQNEPSGMMLDQSNETNGDVISQFMNPLKWFR